MAFLKGIWGKWQHLLHNDKWKHKIYVVIFESDTRQGNGLMWRLSDLSCFSILVVIAESIQGWSAVIGPYLRSFSEYVFTFFFTVGISALYCSPRPRKYALSFFGIVDFAGDFASLYRLVFRHGAVFAGNPYFPADSGVSYL